MSIGTLYAIVTCICLVLVQGLDPTLPQSSGPLEPSSRILNGERPNPLDYQFVVRLQPGGNEICGGSIIDKNFILTAGHCIDDATCREMEIFTSVWTLRSANVPIIHVADCYKHDNYVEKQFSCDIGLIKTRENLVDQLQLKVIPLPPPNMNHPEGTLAVIAGWGMEEDDYHAEYLKKGDQKIYDWDGCNFDYQHAEQCASHMTCPVRTIPKRSRCAIGFGNNPAGSGGGDSGGPVIVDGYLVGVIVGSIKKNGSVVLGTPTLYMNTVRFLPWINSYLNLRGGEVRQIPRDNESC